MQLIGNKEIGPLLAISAVAIYQTLILEQKTVAVDALLLLVVLILLGLIGMVAHAG